MLHLHCSLDIGNRRTSSSITDIQTAVYMEQAQNSFSDPGESSRTQYINIRKMIESEHKLALMTRNLENHMRTTAYERSEINGYLNG